jgi:ferredoxin/flavodoxin---NADP+ reductase
LITKGLVSEVLSVRRLTTGTAVVRLRRCGLAFTPGQYVRVGGEGDPEIRDYSIYSGVGDDFIEILVRRVENGLVSIQLCDLAPGSAVSLGGPYGHFKLTEQVKDRPLLFVASGTGISPFQSFIRSHPALDYQLLHGIRFAEESYDAWSYGERYMSCVTQGSGGHFRGRVTEKLRTMALAPETEVFLCGNCDMIYDAFDLLKERGIQTDQLHTEVYF